MAHVGLNSACGALQGWPHLNSLGYRLPYNLVYKSSLCGPWETNEPLQGGTYSKGGVINHILGQCLVITYLPIVRVDSSYISGASPSFIRLIKGGTYNPKNVRTVTLS